MGCVLRGSRSIRHRVQPCLSDVNAVLSALATDVANARDVPPVMKTTLPARDGMSASGLNLRAIAFVWETMCRSR